MPNVTLDNYSQVQQSLKALRLAIIGDDDEKLELINSAKLDDLFQILNQLINSVPEGFDPLPVLDHLLVIIHSLTYFPPALHKLLDTYDLTALLVKLALKYESYDDVLISVLKTLANILSLTKFSSSTSLNTLGTSKTRTETDLSGLFVSKITHSNNGNLLLSILKLISLLNPLELQVLIFPLTKILTSLTEPYKELLITNSKKYLTFFESEYVPTPPTEEFPTLLAPLLFSLSNLLSFDKVVNFNSSNDLDQLPNMAGLPVKIDSIIDREVCFITSSFLKSNDYELKLSTLTLLVNFSINSNLSSSEKNQNVLKLLPYLIQLINIDEKNNNFRIYKSSLNLSRKFNPLYILSKLSLDFEFVNTYLLNCNILVSFIEILKKFNSKVLIESNSPYYLNLLEDFSDLFLILSSVTANDEDNRKMLLKDELFQLSEKSLKFHHDIISKLLTTTGSVIHPTPENNTKLELIFVTNQLSISICYLLRSLSRSVTLLRTRLNESNIIETLMEFLKIPESEIVQKFQLISKDIVNNFILLKTVILSIMSNLVLDFSPLRTKLLNNNLILHISQILSSSSFDNVKFNCLWVVGNVIYKETPIIMEQIIDQIGLLEIFRYCSEKEDLKIQEQAFNVLRNLTCSRSKSYMINKILKNFNDYYKEELDNPENSELYKINNSSNNNLDAKFFQFLNVRLSSLNLLDPKNNGLIETIIYIIVHTAVINEHYRDVIIENTSLMTRIREILINSKNIQVKLSCVWVVINLTWFENLGERTQQLNRRRSTSTTTRTDRAPAPSRTDHITFVSRDEFRIVEEEGTADINDQEGDVVPDQRGSHVPSTRTALPIITSNDARSQTRADTSNDEAVTSSEGDDADMDDGGSAENSSAILPNIDEEIQSRNELSSHKNAQIRVEQLNRIGLKGALKDLIESSDNIDLKERIRTALFNLNQFP